jgi:hypothetical protein
VSTSSDLLEQINHRRASSTSADVLGICCNLLDMRVSFGNAGWVAIDGLGLPGPLYVRVRQDGTGRLRVKELYLDASANDDVPITGNDLRQLSLSRVEALINAHSNAVLHRVRRVGPDLSTLATYYVTSFGNYERQIKERNWVVLNFANQLDPEEADQLPEFERVQPKTREWHDVRSTDLDFRLPSSGPTDGLTNEFLQDVARAYAAAVARGERPNVAMAGQTGYPLKSVQRWVYTARQRGIMPRGSRGRPG